MHKNTSPSVPTHHLLLSMRALRILILFMSYTHVLGPNIKVSICYDFEDRIMPLIFFQYISIVLYHFLRPLHGAKNKFESWTQTTIKSVDVVEEAQGRGKLCYVHYL